MHNGMGDQGETQEGESHEDGASSAGGATRPAPRPRRRGRGRRGGAPGEAGVDRITVYQKDDVGGDENHISQVNVGEGETANFDQSRPLRRGGRFRRGGRQQSGGNRHPKREIEGSVHPNEIPNG